MNEGAVKYVLTLPYAEVLERMQQYALETIFLPTELDLYNQGQNKKSLAARFLIKEKLIEHFKPTLAYHDIFISNLPNGKPQFELGQGISTENIHISISHSRNYISVIIIIG